LWLGSSQRCRDGHDYRAESAGGERPAAYSSLRTIASGLLGLFRTIARPGNEPNHCPAERDAVTASLIMKITELFRPPIPRSHDECHRKGQLLGGRRQLRFAL
jgi:hypothetical protein